MADQFREVESAFSRLKEKFSQGRISQPEFIDALKQLRIKDEAGRFWMIGAQSGKWYFFNGDDWVQAKPPSFSERKAICIYCGYENDLEAETCVRCGSQKPQTGTVQLCPRCGARLENPDAPCPDCEPLARMSADGGVPPDAPVAAAGGTNLIIRALHAASFFWFFGVLGLFAGMLLGLLVGVTSFFPGLVAALPGFFADIQGKLLGGVVFTVAGGCLGFLVGGPAGFAAAAAANGVLSLVGGIRVLAAKAPGRREDKERP
jgi:ribosomal protein L40E